MLMLYPASTPTDMPSPQTLVRRSSIPRPISKRSAKPIICDPARSSSTLARAAGERLAMIGGPGIF